MPPVGGRGGVAAAQLQGCERKGQRFEQHEDAQVRFGSGAGSRAPKQAQAVPVQDDHLGSQECCLHTHTWWFPLLILTAEPLHFMTGGDHSTAIASEA